MAGEPCPHADSLPGRRTVCDTCQRERKNERDRQRYAKDSESKRKRAAAYYAEHRDQVLARQRAWDQSHREEKSAKNRESYYRDHEATLERKRAEREAIRRDPQRWAAKLEYYRMWRRLRAELAGRPMAPVPEHRYPAANNQWTMEAGQLRALVSGWLDSGETLAELAHCAEVSERLLYRLLHEDARVSVAAADRIVMALGLHLDLLDG